MLAASDVRLDTNALDFAILGVYFVTVLGVGFIAKRYIKTSLDYFLSGRSLPAWITGLAFVSANLGATEVLGMAANGAQYGVATVNYYWIGAIPAMVFLGLVMMPFYYGSKVRSVPEYLLQRFNSASHKFNSWTFAIATILIAGVNLYALEGTGTGNVTNPIGVSWIGIVFGLGFVLSFGYWTTNFAEVQRALSAKDLSSAERTPLIGAIPKLFLPFIMIVPGLIALVVIPKMGTTDELQFNNAVPLLMNRYLPNGMLGIAITGLMASFMAGVAANV